jgi:predicted P-loop ATPase
MYSGEPTPTNRVLLPHETDGEGAHPAIKDARQLDELWREATSADVSSIVTVIQSQGSALGKHFNLEQDGNLGGTTLAQMTDGDAFQVPIAELALLKTLREGMLSCHALLYGGYDWPNVHVGTQNREKYDPTVLARDKKHIKWLNRPGLWFCDADVKDYFPDMTPEIMHDILSRALSWWCDSDVWYPYSSSSGIARSSDGALLKPHQNFRIYRFVSDPSRIPALGLAVHAALWEAGYGRVIVDAGGALRDKTPLDQSVYQPSRLDFVKPSLGPGLHLVSKEGLFVTGKARILDAAGKGIDGSLDDWHRSSTLYRDAYLKKRPEQKQRITENIKRDVAKAVAEGESEAAARIKAERLYRHGTLMADAVLTLVDGKRVTVAEVLANPELYDEERCADPAEPEYRNDPRICYLELLGDGEPRAYSHAHGGCSYRLVKWKSDYNPLHVVAALPATVKEKPGAPFTPDAIEAFAILERLNKAAYEQVRGELKEAKFSRNRELDREVKKAATSVADYCALFAEPEDEVSERLEAGVIEFPQLTKFEEPVLTSVANVQACLKHMGITAWYDAFRIRTVIEGLARKPVQLDDGTLLEIWGRIQALNFFPTQGAVRDAVNFLAREDTRHPIRDGLDGLVWDGKPRLKNLFAEYAKAEGTPYQRACGVLLLVAMVRRVRKPGAKFDQVIILKGAQGLGKSGFSEVLAGEEFFTDSFSFSLDDKTMIEQTEGMWLAEAAEMRGLLTKDIDSVKAMVTRKVDRARKAYGRATTNAPRQFVSVASTNKQALYSDHTGGRRWDIIEITGFDWDAVKRDREQLFAEAAELEKSYGPLVLPEEVIAEATEIQERHRIVDPVHAAIEETLEGLYGFMPREELYRALDIGPGREHLKHNTRYSIAIQEITSKLGWKKHRLYRGENVKKPHGFIKHGPNGEERDRKGKIIELTHSGKVGSVLTELVKPMSESAQNAAQTDLTPSRTTKGDKSVAALRTSLTDRTQKNIH